MKNWLLNKKLNFTFTILGSVIGFAYWKFIGCESGNCAITSIWYRVTLYGAIMGWLIASFIKEQTNRSKTKQDE